MLFAEEQIDGGHDRRFRMTVTERMIGGDDVRQPTRYRRARRDGHLIVYLAWPLWAGVGLAAVLGIPTLGIGLLTGATWAVAAGHAAVVAMVALPVGSIGTFLYASGSWAGPKTLAMIERERLEPPPAPPPVKPEVRFIPVKRRAGIRREPPALPSTGARGGHQAALGVLFKRLLARPVKDAAVATRYEQDAQGIEPSAQPWVIEFYDTLTTMWRQPLTRRSWEEHLDHGQVLYRRYLAGDGSGMHGKRGVWDIWGIVERGPRGTWVFAHDLQTILSLDEQLQVYADAKAAMVSPSPSGGGSLARARGGCNRTKPNHEPNHEPKGENDV